MRLTALLILIAVFMSQCSSGSAGDFEPGPAAKRYHLKGKVVSVNKAAKTAAIAHEEIPGFMSAMTMDFRIKEDWVWDVIRPGAEISADLVVDNVNGRSWLENTRITSVSAPPGADTVRDDKASVGRPVPEFNLTNQDGRQVSPSVFKGKAWALTFIYTRCPLPDYCILMSKNFSDLARRIAKDDALKDRIRLLSISFDPQWDTPERLRKYGLAYLGKDTPEVDFSVWQLAVGSDEQVAEIADFFGLRYEADKSDKTQIIHSLRTAVIGPDGRITRIFAGNEWTTDDLLNELKAALSKKGG